MDKRDRLHAEFRQAREVEHVEAEALLRQPTGRAMVRYTDAVRVSVAAAVEWLGHHEPLDGPPKSGPY